MKESSSVGHTLAEMMTAFQTCCEACLGRLRLFICFQINYKESLRA